MSERKDDGSLAMGVWATLAAIGFFFAGYWFRDSGHTIQVISRPAPQPITRIGAPQ